jgi:hypothetical protein
MRSTITLAVTLAVMLAVVACKDGKERMNEAKKDVDKAVDTLELDDAKQHLVNAQAALAKGLDAVEDCTWAATVASDVVKDPVTELRRLCSFDAPLGRATRAVDKAEKARAEQPDAPSLTECQSDSYAKAAKELDASFATEPRWTSVKARWTKVCPGA